MILCILVSYYETPLYKFAAYDILMILDVVWAQLPALNGAA